MQTSKSNESKDAPASTRRGITLRSLRAIDATVKGLVADGYFSEVSCYSELTTTVLVYGWVKKVTGSKRFVDCPDLFSFADAGMPQYFVSHAWGGSFALLVAHVIAHLKNASEETRVWLDIFAVNQHGGVDDLPEAQQENQDDVASLKATLGLCVGTIVVVDLHRCNPASRGWCLYEWDKTITFLGLEALYFVGVSGKDLSQIVRAVSVAAAKCFLEKDLAMIQKEVEENHGSLAAFDEALKLVLLFAPTSFKVDLEQLDKRSEGTLWNFDAVRLWLKDPAAPRALCILGAAGTGKSSVSAALLREVLGRPVAGRPGEMTGPPAAFHFLKYSDLRRLEPVAILKSLTCQLGCRLAGLAAALCALEGEAVAKLTTIEAACELLLKPLVHACSEHADPVVILFDALDEADPPEQQRPGFDPAKDHVEPVANKAVHLLVTQLVPKLPKNVRFIFSARPDTMLGEIKPVLCRAFSGGIMYLPPNAVRSGSGTGDGASCEESNLVYDTVVRGCQLGGKLQSPVGAPRLSDVYEAYVAAFDQAPLEDGVRRLLEVILAAFEPLPVALLQQIGLHAHLTALPGWDTLFYVADHHLHIIHKSLSDWLNNKWLSGSEGGGGGHRLLAAHLHEHEVLTATDLGAAGGVAASMYALKYTVPHLVRSLGAGAAQARTLDRALGQWPFIRQAFQAGHGAKLVAALGRAETDGRLSDYGSDALRWLRRCYNDFEGNAITMEVATLRVAPIFSPKYNEASTRLHATYLAAEGPRMPRTSLILGRVSENSWPADTNIFKGHSGAVLSVAFSRDGRSLATGSEDKTVRVWNLSSGQCIATLMGHSGTVWSVAFSFDGRSLATGSNEKTARVWNLASGQCTMILEGHSDDVRSIAFSPKDLSLATGSSDNTVRIWDPASGRCTSTLEGHSDWVNSVAFSPDGCWLASGSGDKTARVWNLESGQCATTLESHLDWVLSVAFSLDGDSLATGSRDNTARLWDIARGLCTATLDCQSVGFSSVASVAFSPDGNSLATCSSDKTARIWDLASNQCTSTFQGHSHRLRSVTFSPDGFSLATGSKDNSARVWNIGSGQSTATLDGHSAGVSSVAFRPDGSLLATCSRDKTARVWDVVSGKCTATLEGHSDAVYSLTFSPNGELLASGSNDMTAQLWDISSGQSIANLKGHSGGVTSVAFSSNGSFLATGSKDKTARLWDLAIRQCVATFEGHSDWVRSVAFSPHDKLLASGSSDKTARVWDLASVHSAAILLEGHLDGVHSVAFSVDGDVLATGSRDTTARLWNLESTRCIATLEGHSDWVRSVAFSPDRCSLATGSKDQTSRVWDLASGQCTATLEGHSGDVLSVSFSPNGRSLATGSHDNTARLWDLVF